jgi:site-specific DNA recombinase
MPARAAIYTRISRDPSGQEAGVRRQEADCRELAAARGWDVVRVFPDNARSATSSKPRPQWNALLDAIEANEVDALVAYSSSRLYRRPADLERLLELVTARRGFQIATVKSGELDLSTADGMMVAGILAQVDRGEVKRMKERIARARKARVADGRDAGGSRPYGYEAKPTGPPRETDRRPRMVLTGAIVPVEADLIREAATRLLNGESIRSILRDWDVREVRTPKGNAWKSPGLRHMLTNVRLLGLHPETGARANWPAILDRRTHEALVALYADPTRLRSRRGGRWLLTGLLFCGKCGGRLTARPSPDHRRYTCDATGSPHLSVAATPLEEHVLAMAEENHPSENYSPDEVRDPAENAELTSRIDDVDARIAAWAREAAAGGLRAADIAAGSKELRAERDRLEGQLVAAEQAAAPRTLTYAEAMPIVEAETRAWLDAVIERITIAPATRKGRVFDPGRVTIAWR